MSIILISFLLGVLLASLLGRLGSAGAAPAQVVTVNPVATARPPGCLSQVGSLAQLAAIGLLVLFFLWLALGS